MTPRRRPPAFGAVALAAAATMAVAMALAADRHLGVATCASTLCHGAARPLAASPVQQNEYVTWSTFDPHGRAYRVLLEPEGRAIARRMGLRNAHEAPECLACHADAVPPAERGERFQVEDGVGCEACHGGAERWIASHHTAPGGGRGASHAANVGAGLVDLPDARTRAATCLGCHVGDERRFATHRMMAAGHPRLVFELDTYTELWRTSGGREHYRIDDDYRARKPTAAPVAVWTTGLVAATRRQGELIATRAGAARGLPDFALYGCYSCHRSMRATDWGEDTYASDGPGALRVQDGHARLLLAVAESLQLRAGGNLAVALRGLQRAASEEPAALDEARRALDRSLDDLDAELRRVEWSRPTVRRVLTGVAAAARAGAFPDYAAAEQAAMGLVVLLVELDLDRTQAREIDVLFAALEDDSRFDRARFSRVLARLAPR